MAQWFDQVTDKYVSNVANKYVNSVGLQVFDIFPEVPTTQKSGLIAKYTKEDWTYIGTVGDYLRQGSTESKGDDYEVGSQGYQVQDYAFHKDISQDDAAEYDNPFDPVKDSAEFVINRLNRIMLQILVNEFMAASIWSADKQGAVTPNFTKWSDGGTASTPVANILSWKEEIQKTTGYEPNRLIMTADVYRYLKTNTDITGKMKTSDDKVVGKNLLARLFEVDTINIIGDVNSTSTDYLLTKKLLLCYTPERATKFAPSAGYTMTLRRAGDRVSTQRIPMAWRNNSLRIEGSFSIDPIMLASDLGIYAYDVVV